VTVAKMETARFVHVLARDEANMSLMYAVERGVTAVSDGPVALRAVSVVAGLVALVGTFALARRLFGLGAAFAAGLVFATSSFVLQFAQEARSSMLAAALLVLGANCLVRGVDDPRRRWWIGLALLTGLATYAHMLALLVLPAFAVCLMLLPRKHVPWRLAIESAVVTCVLVSPVLVTAVERHSNQPTAVPRLSLRVLGGVLAEAAGGGPLMLAAVAGCVGAGVWFLVRSMRGGRRVEAYRAAIAILPFAVPFAVLTAVSVFKPFLSLRFVAVFVPWVALATGMGLARLPRKRLIAGLALLVILTVPQFHRYFYAQPKEDLARATNFIAARALRTDGVVVLADREMLYNYYAARTPGAPRPLWYPPPSFDPFPLAEVKPPPFGQALAGHRNARTWLVIPIDARLGTNGNPPGVPAEAALAATEDMTMRARFPGVEVELFAPRTTLPG
jgi:4-amino-4-deoxy-L-arabinose transferase-like glycosyltransferase